MKVGQFSGWLLCAAFTVCSFADPKPARELKLPSPAIGNVVVTRRIVYSADKLFLFQLERADQPRLRERDKESSFQLKIYPFRGKTGELLASTSYPSLAELNEVFRLADDQMVVRLDESVAVISPDAKIIFAERMPRLKDFYSRASLLVSSDGRSFFVSYRNRRSDPLRIRQFDTATLQPRLALRLEGDQEPIAASNQALLYRRRNSSLEVYELWIQTIPNSPPRLLYRFKKEECVPTASFLADDQVAVLTCNKLRFLDLSGKETNSVKLGDSGALGKVLISTDRRRVTFQVFKTQPMRYIFGPALGQVEGQRILVWDVPSRSFHQRLSLGREHKREPDFAFSPTGEEVAILEGDTIKIYSVNQ